MSEGPITSEEITTIWNYLREKDEKFSLRLECLADIVLDCTATREEVIEFIQVRKHRNTIRKAAIEILGQY